MDPQMEKQSFLRDFFFELYKDSDNLKQHHQLDRQIWFRNLELNRKEEYLFELEMHLRAIHCFFNLHNQFIQDQERVIVRDFSSELQVLSAALERSSALSQLLLDRGLASSLNFQSYVENQAAPDSLRLQMLKRSLDQKRPEESLHLLNRCFRDLRKTLDHILKRKPCTYHIFYSLGQIITREIAFNRFFNPILILEFRVEYDRIRSVAILDAIRSIQPIQTRRAISKIYLALFRLLHYLRYIPRQGKPARLRRSLILFTLFRSEASTLAGYLHVLHHKPELLSCELAQACQQVATGLTETIEQMFGDGLVCLDIRQSKLVGDEERTVASSREMLEHFLKNCITRFVQATHPDITTATLFNNKTNQLQQGLRLRDDLWLYIKILERWMDDAANDASAQLFAPSIGRLCNYFMATSYHFLRHGEGGPFERFVEIVKETQPENTGGRWLCYSLEDVKGFRNYLYEIYDCVCCRAELVNQPLDLDELHKQLDLWLFSNKEPGQPSSSMPA